MLMMTGRHRPPIIGALPEGYARLFDRTVAVLGADERVRAVWLGGSLGRGDAETASDLEVIVTVADESYPEFTQDWLGWLDAITATEVAAPVPSAPGSFYAVTPESLRLQVSVETAGSLHTPSSATRLVVLDRDGLSRG
jgi:predicted nucleotidyltransferase